MRANLRYITRLEYKTTRPGWWVRIGQREINVQRQFADADYGGKRASLAAAKHFRDEQLRALDYVPAGYKTRPRRRLGINYFEGMSGKRWRQYWCASWMEDGRQRKKVFAVGRKRTRQYDFRLLRR